LVGERELPIDRKLRAQLDKPRVRLLEHLAQLRVLFVAGIEVLGEEEPGGLVGNAGSA
jgi:hypothetical protein